MPILAVVLTDLVGSTAAMAERGDARGQALLQIHELMVRERVGRYGGREVKALGDGFLITFASAREAIRFAAALQHAMVARNEQHPDHQLPLRVGITAGEVVVRGGDVFGTTVNTAARVTERAAGGEILVAESVKHLLGSDPDLKLVDRGRHSLRGLPDQCGIYEVDWTAIQPESSGRYSSAEPGDWQSDPAADGPVHTLAPNGAGGTSVLIVDDEELVRAGFRLILESQPQIVIAGEASNGAQAIAAANELHPDVVLMDIRMPNVNGLEATRQIVGTVRPPPKVIVLTTFDHDEYVYEALRAGASAFLLKDAPLEQLISAVRVVAAGDALLHPSITRRLIEDFARQSPAAPSREAELEALTVREREVLRLVAHGLSNAEIAVKLFLGETTVKTHLSNIFLKFNLRDRTQAVILAYETGLVRPGEE